MKKSSVNRQGLRIRVMLAMGVLIMVFCGCSAVMAATQDGEENAAQAVQTDPMPTDAGAGDADLQEAQDPETAAEDYGDVKGTSDDPVLQTLPAEPKGAGKENSKAKMAKPPKVRDLRGTSGYRSVILKWDAVDKPASGSGITVWYRVYRAGKLIHKVKDPGNAKTIRKVCKAKEGYNSRYFVRAVYVKDKRKVLGPKSKAIWCGAVRPIKYSFTTNQRAPYYTTYKGNRVGGYIRKGKRMSANGAINTRYIIHIKGKTRWLSLRFTKNRSADYVRGSKRIYTRTEAENYVNGRKLTSRTNYLVWVSAYSQRVYVFKKSGKKWKCKKDYICATGGMDAPTPSGELKIWSHLLINHGLYYWSNFYSITAFHQNPSNSIGYPSSTGGCVRMWKDSAKYIYDHVPLKTKVLVF